MKQWVDEELPLMEARNAPPRRRVLLGLLLPVTAGVAVGLHTGFSPLWFMAAAALLLLSLFKLVAKPGSFLLIYGVLFCLMAAHAGLQLPGRAGNSLARVMARQGEYIQLLVTAEQDAVRRSGRPGRQQEDVVWTGTVEALNRIGEWQRIDDAIRVVMHGVPPDAPLPRYGEQWRMTGRVETGITGGGGLFALPFNRIVVDADRTALQQTGKGNPFVNWCMQRRRACQKILGTGLEDFPEEAGVLQALILGYRENLPSTLRRDFAATGTVHIFAISGAHVGMVSLILMKLLGLLGIPKNKWFWTAIPLLVIYTVMTGASVSAVRACIMASTLLIAPAWNRRPDALSSLALAAIIILIANPSQLGDLGFLLSFTAVAGLLIFQPGMAYRLAQWFKPDPWQLQEEGNPLLRRGRYLLFSGGRYASVSLSAWLGTSPLTAYFFNLFSPIALLMNLFVIPAAFLILCSGVFSICGSWLSISIAEIFNHSARVVIAVLAASIRWAARVPGGHWFVRAPPVWLLAVWYGILLLAAMWSRRVKGIWTGGMALVFAITLGWYAYDATRGRVTVFNVGEGNAVLVQAAGETILVDIGEGYRAPDVLRLLRREGVNRLDVLVLTHTDAAHIGAAAWLMGELLVKEIWMSLHMWKSPTLAAVLSAAEAHGIPIRYVGAGESGYWPGHFYWEALWPPHADYRLGNADDGSLVLRVARYGASILLMADAGARQEQAIMARMDSVASPVLLAGRHGDAAATSPAWLNAVRPRHVIISSGPHSGGRHPDAAMLERLNARGITVWRTDEQGNIRMDFGRRIARWPDTGYDVAPAQKP